MKWWKKQKRKVGRPRNPVVVDRCLGCHETIGAEEKYITVAILETQRRAPILKLYYHLNCFEMIWEPYFIPQEKDISKSARRIPMKERAPGFYDVLKRQLTEEDQFFYGL